MLPGSRCYENFFTTEQHRVPDAIVQRTGIAASDLDSLICAGQPDPVTKEQDGDSGGPVLVTVASEYVQVAVNTGSWASDELISSGPGDFSYVGLYTAINWHTIMPWFTKILAGDYAGAKAMTCTELGGPTMPRGGRMARTRRQLESRRLIQAESPGGTAGRTHLPFMTATGTVYGGGWVDSILGRNGATRGTRDPGPWNDPMERFERA